LDLINLHDSDPHAPAFAGVCALPAPDSRNVQRIGGDLLDQLEAAGRQELAALLETTSTDGAHVAALDPVESVIAWDLAAGF